jgi:peptidyl-prolyl cis-trans isomerase C
VKKLTIFLVVALAAAAGSACRKAPAPAATASAGTGTSGQTPAASAPLNLPATPKPVPAQLPDVLARVNGQDVKKADLDRLVRDMELGQGPIPSDRRDEVLRTALDRLITYTVLSQEAKARNVTATDAEVDQRVKEMQQQFPNEDAFKKALTDRSMTLEALRSDTRKDLVINKMMEAEVSSAPAASDEEARDFYAKNPDKFKQGEQVRASHILIRVDEKADAAAKQKARAEIDAVLKRAKAGEDFAALAKQHSQDGSAAQGGDLSYFVRGQMVPAFEEAAFSLQPGQISDVVTTPFGYHIIKVTDHKAATTVPLEQVNDRVKQFLTGQKKQQKADEFIAGLKQKSKIEVLI